MYIQIMLKGYLFLSNKILHQCQLIDNILWAIYHCVEGFKYGVFSGKYFPVVSSNTGKKGPEKIP